MTDSELLTEFKSRFCTIAEAASIAHTTRQWIEQLIALGRLRATDIKPFWVSRASLADYIQERDAPKPAKAVKARRPVGRPRKAPSTS